MLLLFLRIEVVSGVSVSIEFSNTTWCGMPGLRSFVCRLPGKLNSGFEQRICGRQFLRRLNVFSVFFLATKESVLDLLNILNRDLIFEQT